MRDLGAELGAPVLVCLEGGYSLGALAASVVATLEALGSDQPAGEAPAEPVAEYRERLAPTGSLADPSGRSPYERSWPARVALMNAEQLGLQVDQRRRLARQHV